MDQNGSKIGPKMIKNVHNRLKETKTRLETIQFRVNGSKKTIRQVSRSDPPYQLVDMVMIIIVFSSFYHEDPRVFRAKLVTQTVYRRLNLIHLLVKWGNRLVDGLNYSECDCKMPSTESKIHDDCVTMGGI